MSESQMASRLQHAHPMIGGQHPLINIIGPSPKTLSCLTGHRITNEQSSLDTLQKRIDRIADGRSRILHQQLLILAIGNGLSFIEALLLRTLHIPQIGGYQPGTQHRQLDFGVELLLD
mmetsp:Transcript_63907/g.76828  ORF Transcript_63907/g.76828 Transcript_63907/m.76828 type:complete len:118 (+) Transcript_63907:194-547(+)